MRFGYARVSTEAQDLSTQVAALEGYGCDSIRSEKASGSSRQGREQLELLLEYVREGDELVVTRIDRLARSLQDLQNIAGLLHQKGVSLKATEQAVDTSSSAGKAFFDMLGVFAEFETNLRRERQLEGIAKAKAEGKYRGRKKTISGDRIGELRKQGLSASQIAEALNVSRASVYRYLP